MSARPRTELKAWIRVRGSIARMLLARSVALTLALVIGSAAVLGGTSYGWCVSLGRVMPSCCCQATQSRASLPLPAIGRWTFELRTIDKLRATIAPASAEPVVATVAAAAIPVTAVRSASSPAVAPTARFVDSLTSTGLFRPSPIRVDPPSRADRLAEICVYRC